MSWWYYKVAVIRLNVFEVHDRLHFASAIYGVCFRHLPVQLEAFSYSWTFLHQACIMNAIEAMDTQKLLK